MAEHSTKERIPVDFSLYPIALNVLPQLNDLRRVLDGRFVPYKLRDRCFEYLNASRTIIRAKSGNASVVEGTKVGNQFARDRKITSYERNQ